MATLEQRIAATEAHLQGVLDSADPARVRIAWTGGKDSTVALFIWKALLEHAGAGPVRAINLDTGCKFPEVMAFRDRLAVEWGIDLHVARPAVALEGYTLAQDPVACCGDLKVAPLKEALGLLDVSHLVTGIRRDEHPDRQARQVIEERDAPAHIVVNPLLDWTETDIWALHTRFDLPYCELYDQGYRSLGCVPCTLPPGAGQGERGGRSQAKEAAMRTLTDLGYF